MRAEVSKLQDDLGVTTIYVTHDQVEAMTMGDRVAVIKKGELQQIDAPQFLYDHPANLFVAGFIGSPAMNMVEADLARENGRLSLSFGSTTLAVDDDVLAERPGVRAYEGKRVIAGVRPENMEDASIMPNIPEDRRMKVEILLREALGAEVLVHFSIDAPPVLTEDTRELVGEQTGPMAQANVAVQELERAVEIGTSTFVARLDPRTRAAEKCTRTGRPPPSAGRAGAGSRAL
jgi:multiple sugar transport system ATP-binding protein